MADEVADLIIDGHVEEAGVDERLAVSHRHEFFALQSQKKETEHFLHRPAGKFAVQLFEVKPELLNDAAGMDRIFHFNLFTELIARLQPQNQDSGSRKVPAPPVGGWRPAVLEVEEKGDQVGQPARVHNLLEALGRGRRAGTTHPFDAGSGGDPKDLECLGLPSRAR